MDRKLVLHTLVYLSITLLVSVLNAEHFTKVENIFQQNVSIKPGDVMQCEITKTNVEETKNKYHVHTFAATYDGLYSLQPNYGFCFWFKVRASNNVHILLINSIEDLKLEIKLEFGNHPSYSAIQRNGVNLMRVNETGIINDKEYRGFWIRWLDDELLEIGKESSTIPFLYYRFQEQLQIKYVGILTLLVEGAWIIDLEPKCTRTKVVKTETESDCFLLK